MSVNVGSNENDRVNKGVSQADIKGCRCKNVSDVSIVSIVSIVSVVSVNCGAIYRQT